MRNFYFFHQEKATRKRISGEYKEIFLYLSLGETNVKWTDYVLHIIGSLKMYTLKEELKYVRKYMVKM